MKNFVIKGDLCFSESMDHIETIENGYLVVKGGVCAGTFRALPSRYADWQLLDCSGKLVFPGMSDLHIHAPQFTYRGLGMDMELLDWLNTYTFPEESKYRDLGYAEQAYGIFVDHLLHSTTTRASIFATVHVPATLRLMEMLEKSGLRTCVGKVNMNRNCPDYIRELSTNHSVRDTRWWLEASLAKFTHTKPIITPRFIPSCTDDLMFALADLQRQYGVTVQSHLSENFGEIEWVKELCPKSKFYGEAYDQFGLFGGDYKCIMAHCVHSTQAEQELMKQRGVFIAHSPESNTNIASGVAPIMKYLDDGQKVGLASDVAGGSHESLLRAMMHAIQASKLRWRLQDQNVAQLTVDRAFYMATMGGGEFFGKVGTFLDGYEADIVVLDDSGLKHPQPLSVRARLERAIYLSDDRHIAAKFVAGEQVL